MIQSRNGIINGILLENQKKDRIDLRIVYVDDLLKLKKTIQKFNYKSDSKRIYHNQLKKSCFQCVATYEIFKDFKDLSRIAVSDNVLWVKRFEISGDPKYDGYQRWLASMVKKFFVKKSSEKRLKIRVTGTIN